MVGKPGSEERGGTGMGGGRGGDWWWRGICHQEEAERKRKGAGMSVCHELVSFDSLSWTRSSHGSCVPGFLVLSPPPPLHLLPSLSTAFPSSSSSSSHDQSL